MQFFDREPGQPLHSTPERWRHQNGGWHVLGYFVGIVGSAGLVLYSLERLFFG